MEIQKAEEFARAIDAQIDRGFCDASAPNCYSFAADLIRARDKAIIERCADRAERWLDRPGCPECGMPSSTHAEMRAVITSELE